MDRRKQLTLDKHPASLLSGLDAKNMANQFLKNFFCKNCKKNCTVCLSIDNQQHPNIIWIAPEKTYTLSDIEPLFSRSQFQLATAEHSFFVLEKADCLSSAVANRLLKLIEEPLPGYHFIFLAYRSTQIVPTIKSRCISITAESKHVDPTHHKLSRIFIAFPLPEPAQFLQTLENIEINETETFELIDQLFIYWQNQIETNTLKKKIIHILMTALEKPPMPGSSKLFWKNLYLQYSMAI